MKPEPTAVDGKSITSTVNTETGKQAFTSLVSFPSTGSGQVLGKRAN
jgi:hypothetical protein